MTDLLSLMARHGYALIFGLLLAEAIGLPFPAAIALVTAGAAIASHVMKAPLVVLAAIPALMLGDAIQFWLGRFAGWYLLGFLCRVSINPETCILRSAESFYKRGRATLVIAKFIPGVNTMAAPLAGSMKMRFSQFLRFDLAGALLYCVTYLLVGYVSRDFLAAGFEVLEVVAIEGPGWLARDFDRLWNNPMQRERLLAAVRKVEREPSILGMTAHIMAVGRKRARTG